tara:strand:- start:4270 stop:4500 length:231 start_codon:yes stop_codon:yes gene_type:complete
MMGDSVSEFSNRSNVFVHLRSCLFDRQLRIIPWEDMREMRLPQSSVLALHKKVLPEGKLQFSNNLTFGLKALRTLL